MGTNIFDLVTLTLKFDLLLKNCLGLWLLNQRGYSLLLFTHGCRRRAMLSALTTLVDFFSATAEWNSTKHWQAVRSQCRLPSLWFLGRSENQDGCPDLWLVKTFSTPLQLLNGIQLNIDRKISMSSTKFVFFRLIIISMCPFQIEVLRYTIVALLASCWRCYTA